jgi:hypothetical protein
MSEDADRNSSRGRLGGETAHQQEGSGVSLPEAACRAMPLRVGVEATDEILAVLSTAGLNALPDPDEQPPRRTIVEVQAESAEEAGQKIRDILGDVPIEPAE